MPKLNTCIFVHGCFWHRHKNCRYATLPKSRVEFWADKLASNVKRDVMAVDALRRQGWRVFTIWECGLRMPNNAAVTLSRMLELLAGNVSVGDLP
jgi:DNA mismatch endonuclease (patch repair protein)